MFKNLTQVEKKTLTIWAVAAIVIFILVIIFRVELTTDGYGEDAQIDKDYLIVHDYNRYYTVSTALNKYYGFINAKEAEALLKILDKDYIKNEKLNEDNVVKRLSVTDEQITFNTGIMCQRRYAKDKVSFYVTGKEENIFVYEGDDETLNSTENLGTRYYEVKLYESKSLFSVEPITEKEFGDECHG